jgi:hypothetical protein
MMVRHSAGARVYVVLARLPARAMYIRGLMLAAAILRIPLFLLLLTLALALQRIEHPTLPPLASGAPGLLVICILLAVLTVALSGLVAARRARIAFFLWLALTFVSFDSGLETHVPAGLSNLFLLARTPLLPIYAVAGSSSRGLITLQDAGALGLVGLYLLGIALVAGAAFERRQLSFP